MKADKQQLIILGLGVVVSSAVWRLSVHSRLSARNMQSEKQMDQQDQIIDEDLFAECPDARTETAGKTASERIDSFDQKVPQGRNFAQLWQQIADVMNECKSDRSVCSAR